MEPVPPPPPLPSRTPEMDEESPRSFCSPTSSKKLSSMMRSRLSDGSLKKKRRESKKTKKNTSSSSGESSDPLLAKRIGKSKSMNEKMDKASSSSKKKSSSKKSASLSPKRGSGKRSSRSPKKVSLRKSGSSSTDDSSQRSSRSTTSSKKSRLSSIMSSPLSEGNLKNMQKDKSKVESADPFLPKRIGKSKSMNQKLDKPSSWKISSEKSASFSAEFSIRKVSRNSSGCSSTDDSSQRSSRSTTSSRRSKLSSMMSSRLSDVNLKNMQKDKSKVASDDPFLPKRIGKSKSMNQKLDKPSSSRISSSEKSESFSAEFSPRKVSRKGSSRSPPKKVSFSASGNTDDSSQRSSRSTTSSKKLKQVSSMMSRHLSEGSFLSAEGKLKKKRKDKSKIKNNKSDLFLPMRSGRKSTTMNAQWDEPSTSFSGEFSSRSMSVSDDSSQRSSRSSTKSEKYRASQRRLESMSSSKEKAARTKAIMDSLVSGFTTAQVTGAKEAESNAIIYSLTGSFTVAELASIAATDNKSTTESSSSTTRKVQFSEDVRLLEKVDYSKFDRDLLWFSELEITEHRNRDQTLNCESSSSPNLDVEGMLTLQERNARDSRVSEAREAVFDMQLVNKKEKELHDSVGLFAGEALENDHEAALAEEYMLVTAPAMESAVWRATHLELHVQLLWLPSNKQDTSAETQDESSRKDKISKRKTSNQAKVVLAEPIMNRQCLFAIANVGDFHSPSDLSNAGFSKEKALSCFDRAIWKSKIENRGVFSRQDENGLGFDLRQFSGLEQTKMLTVIAPPTISFVMSTLVVQPAITVMAAASFACLLPIVATVILLTCKLMNDALNTNIALHVHAEDKNDAGWKVIFAAEDAMNLAPSSESSSNDSRAVSANKVQMETKKTKATTTTTSKFVGPAFVEYRDPQPEFDEDDDDDESSIASAPPAATTDIIYPERAGPVFDEEEEYHDLVLGGPFHDYRDPTKNDFDEDDHESTASSVDIMEDATDVDMEELLNAFSTLYLEENTSKTASDDSMMAELVDSFAKL